MSEIAIVTFHRACNYGAFLQAYALQEFLNRYPDMNAFVFDYKSNDIERRYRPTFILSKKEKGNPLKKVCKFILDYKDVHRRNHIFKEARNHFFRLKAHELTKQQLSQASKEYDAFIAGSDQVWNRDIIHQDNAYFLDFVSPPVRKYSYAASIGKTRLTKMELDDLTAMLSGYERISVREPDIVSEFEQFSSLSPVSCSLDPVFLFDAEQWKQFARFKERKPYVLFFMMGQSSNALPAMEFAKEIAKEKKLDIVYLSDNERWYKFRELTHFGVASPSEFVGLIENADYVVTNSFHATAFSIILHKNFFVETDVLRNNRILNLLQITGLEQNGLLKGKSKRSVPPVNWQEVDIKLAPMIAKSKEYIDGIVSDLKNEQKTEA